MKKNVNNKDVELFWDLFRYVDWTPDDMAEIRKIGHQGTYQQSVTLQPALLENPARVLTARCERAAGKVGFFMCPGVLTDRKANDDSVKQLVCVSVDIDTGDTDEKLEIARQMFGNPTLVVHSGGYTEQDKKKLHLHWRLSEPEEDVKRVAAVRDALARRIGGDSSFKRIPQVIRIPGSVYDKTNDGRPVQVLESNPDNDFHLGDFEDKMPKEMETIEKEQAVSMDFSKKAEEQENRFHEIAGNTIVSGGDDHDNRFTRFTEYAGRWIAHARSGDCTIAEAKQYVHNWNNENMKPSWPTQRVEQEFTSILMVDKKNHAEEWASKPQEDKLSNAVEEWSWLDFNAQKLFAGKPDPIPFIVDQMIVEGSTHGLVADGGIGKTYVALELGLRAAIGPNSNNKMLGFDVVKECVTVLITVEDTRDDLHRRMHNIDRGGRLLSQTEGRFLVLPVADEVYGGLTLVERDKKGNHTVSHAWQVLTDKLSEVREVYPEHPMIIILDTYSATHHGDENSSAGTNEWFRSASIVRNQYNAAVFVTHHIRKTNSNPITTPDEMRQHIRGSNAFVNNCRVVFGLWKMPGGKGLSQEAAGDQEEQSSMQFLNFSPLKSNIGIDWADRTSPEHPEPIITLRRTGVGQPIYDADIHMKRITYKKRKEMKEKKKAQRVEKQTEAAVLKAIELYSLRGRPLNLTDLTKDREITLPYPINQLPRKEIKSVVNRLISDQLIVVKNIKSNRTRMNVHDIVDGPYATGKEEERIEDSVVIKWAEYEYNDDEGVYLEK